ncbi:MAG TPA: hypothetical protein PLN33_08190 [Hyphomonadaceae bacterium]|jgi:hypothetical protein|nr:hypothetical protein [Hyphomonadaceae bacterium]HPN06018.1 hypothetical protein [Hyphomonadaceae bacterium]
MRRLTALVLLTGLATAACAKPTELASNANGKGRETVAAADAGTPPPEIPADELAAIAAEQGTAPVDPNAPIDPSAPVDPNAPAPASTAATVTDFRNAVAGNIGSLPSVGDPAALATAFADWKARAASAPGAYEQGQVQLGADPQEYNPSDAELVAAEAGDRLSAALRGADDATKAAVAATLGDAPEARVYRRFDYRGVDVMGSGRYVYASKPKEAALPL